MGCAIRMSSYSDDWDNDVTSSDDESLTEAQKREMQELADAQMASDAFSGTSRPDGTLNKAVDMKVCPTCLQGPKNLTSKTKKISSNVKATKKQVIDNPWDEIKVTTALELDKATLELSRKVVKANLATGTINRMFKNIIENTIQSNYTEKEFNTLIQNINQIKKKHMAGVNEKKIEKNARATMRDPIKAQIAEAMDDYGDFF